MFHLVRVEVLQNVMNRANAFHRFAQESVDPQATALQICFEKRRRRLHFSSGRFSIRFGIRIVRKTVAMWVLFSVSRFQ